MGRNPSPRGASASRGLLFTCALSFIISSIPLAALIFVYNPHILKGQAEPACVAPEIQPNEKVIKDYEVKQQQQQRELAITEAKLKEMESKAKHFQEENERLRNLLKETSTQTYAVKKECEEKRLMSQAGFEESFRRFEIVQGYFEKCKGQTQRLGKILIEAEAEITNLTKQLTHCNLLNNKMEGEKRLAERRSNHARNATVTKRTS